ncbi:MAG: hypothetical protein ACU0A4_09385 [Paracoccaceae bacterium]
MSYTYEDAMKALRAADAAGNVEDAKQLAQIAQRLKGQAQSGEQFPLMSQLNRGIADSVGGLVDFINPFDAQTGSARTGLTNVMERGGIEVAQGEPQTAGQAFMRGTGEAAGALLPVAGTLQAARTGTGIAANIADDAFRAITTTGGATTEALAGGLSETARFETERRGGGEIAQNVAAVLAPAAAIPGAIAAGQQAARYLPSAVGARQLSRNVAAAVAPYTQSGANEVARRRVQELAGGPERAAELARRIEPENEFGLTPAQQTNDPNMLAIEQTAAQQDPNLRARLEGRMEQSQAAGRDAVDSMGGNVQDARDFFTTRRREFRTQIDQQAQDAIERADARLARSGPTRSESENSLIVMDEIDKALSDSLIQEKALWDSVPVAAKVGTENARARALRLIDETPRAQQNDVPRVLRDLLASEDGFEDMETVREMHGLYSELRRIARTAMAGNDQNKNMARIANNVAEGILEDLGAVDGSTAIGRQINEARAYSAALHETYDRGAVGRLLKRTIDGDTAIDPELALNRTVGRSGATAAVAARQLEEATVSPRTTEAVTDYIRDRFTRSAVSATGEFTKGSAAKFMRDNAELMKRYPELRGELDAAVRQRESADAFAARIENRVKALDDARRSATAAFLGGPPDRAIRAVLDAKVPAQAARRLANEASKDPSGQALAGVKAAFSDHLIQGQFTGRQLQDRLDEPKFRSALSQVFNQGEIARLQRIATEMAKLDAARATAPSIGSNLSGARPAKVIEYLARVVAARQGAQLGGGGGASLQTAQMASARARDFMNSIVSDKASELLSRAVEDPELFRSLMMDMGSVSLEKVGIPRILPYLIGTGAAVATGIDGEFR